MGNLFGKPRHRQPATPAPTSTSSSPSVSSQDLALLELKRQRDRLQRYSLRLDRMIDEETALTKALLKEGKKDRAAIVLRRRRYQQKMREGVEAHIDNIQRLAGSIEWAAVQVQVVAALEKGKTALERLNAEVSVERVEQLMEETDEAVQEQRRVEELLGGGSSWTDSQDEEVEAEVQRMEEEETQRTAAAQPTAQPAQLDDAAIAALPAVPTRPIVPVTSASPTLPPRRKAPEVLVAQ